MKLFDILFAFFLAGVSVLSVPLPSGSNAPAALPAAPAALPAAPAALPAAPAALPAAPAAPAFTPIEGDVVKYLTPMRDGSTKGHPAVVLDNGTPDHNGVIHYNIAETSHKLPKKYKHRQAESKYNIGDKTGAISMTPKNVPATDLGAWKGGSPPVAAADMQQLHTDMDKCKNKSCGCLQPPGSITSRSLGGACPMPARNHKATSKLTGVKAARTPHTRPAKKVGGVRQRAKKTSRAAQRHHTAKKGSRVNKSHRVRKSAGGRKGGRKGGKK